MKLTQTQIAQYAYNAGFRGAALNQAVAIAWAESGGNTNAYNPEAAAGTRSGSGSRGLWQIYGTAHPEFNNSQVFDPQANANAAFKVFREAGNRFTPWSTFNLGMARIKNDFSKIAFPKTRVNPVSVVARGSTTPILNTNPVQGAVDSATDKIASKFTLRNFLGLPPKTESDTGPKSAEDIAFLIFGGTFVFIGIVVLLVSGITGAYNAQGKLIMSNASKIAPLIA